VHRDIKPGNILVDAGTERVRVADFGLAQIASDTSQTRSGMITGTPQFMSPEQVRGETCDARSDLFSLGSVMYAMCVGHAPFRAPSLYAVMQRIVHDEVSPVRDMHRALPEWLDHLILKLLEKTPAHRFRSAEEVASILRAELAYLQNPAQLAPPQRHWYAPQRPSRSRRTHVLMAAFAIMVGAATLGTGLAAWQSINKAPTVDHDQISPSAVASPPLGLTRASESVGGDAKTNATAMPTDPPVVSVSRADIAPLWETDGWNQTAIEIGVVENQWRASHELSDGWAVEVQALEQQMLELSRDSSF
jgi:serine/threonine protein kinase